MLATQTQGIFSKRYHSLFFQLLSVRVHYLASFHLPWARFLLAPFISSFVDSSTTDSCSPGFEPSAPPKKEVRFSEKYINVEFGSCWLWGSEQ